MAARRVTGGVWRSLGGPGTPRPRGRRCRSVSHGAAACGPGRGGRGVRACGDSGGVSLAVLQSCCAAAGTCVGAAERTSEEPAASVAKTFSCQRPRTLAVVYVIPSSPDRRYQKVAIKGLFTLLIKPLISQNVCQRQPQRVRPVLSVQDAPSDRQGNGELGRGPGGSPPGDPPKPASCLL